MSRRSLAAKARAAVRAASLRQGETLPASLRHLFQPYTGKGKAKPEHIRRRPSAAVVPIGKRLIEAITEIQLGICPACDDWLEFDPEFDISHPLRPSIDHVVPRAKGGGHLGNKLVMHRECNCAKGDRMPNGCERLWLAVVNARLGL